jgi:hypothetical protein
MELTDTVRRSGTTLIDNVYHDLDLFIRFESNRIKGCHNSWQQANLRDTGASFGSFSGLSRSTSLAQGRISLSLGSVRGFASFSQALIERVGLRLHAIGLILHRAELSAHGVGLLAGGVSLPLGSVSQFSSVFTARTNHKQLPPRETSINDGRQGNDGRQSELQFSERRRGEPAPAIGLLVIGIAALACGCHLLIIRMCFDDKKRQRLMLGAMLFVFGLAVFHFSLYLILK